MTMKRMIVMVALMLGVLLGEGCHGAEASDGSSPNEEQFFDEAGAKHLLAKINDVYWESVATFRKFSDDILSPEILMREQLRPYYQTLEKYDWHNFESPQLRRQFEVILRNARYPPVNYEFKRATQILNKMSRKKWVCPLGNGSSCNMAFVQQIRAILTNSDNLDEIKYYWQEWRNKMPTDVKDALHYYIAYYQNASTPTMRPSALWYDQYEDPKLMDELEELMATVRPFYRELHAHIAHVLRIKYGNDVIDASGLIPHHLMEQVTYQAWRKNSVLRNPFPERKLPNLQAEMNELHYTPFDLVNMSVSYFTSLGFRDISDAFMHDHFIAMESGTGGADCKSRIFDYGEVELHYCPKVHYKKLLQTHGDVTRIEYALAKNYLRVGLNQEACPGFGAALGEAIILSVSNPRHLQQDLGFLPDYEYDELLNLNRLYRLAVHTLLTLPMYFVHEKLWIDMIDGNIAPKDYNCHYWNLMQKYMGVKAPVETEGNAYDMPYKFYEGIVDQYRSTKKVFGEFLGYQIYRAICLNVGEYERQNAYKTLDNCAFAGNKHAGKFLRDMMESGSTRSWREVIKPLTINGENKLSASAFLEFFEPLHQWLREDNLQKNLQVGWMTADKC